MTIVFAVAVTSGVFLVLSVALLIAERYFANYGDCNIAINDGSMTFRLQGGGTLLAALFQNRLFIPSACGGKGSCGYCKVRVAEGGGPLLPTELPFMSRSEMRTGVRLACQVKVRQDVALYIPEDLLAVKEYKARVSRVVALTYDMREVTFDLIEPAEIKQRPGQYIQIVAPGPEGPVYRAYSISSPASTSDKVQLVVRLVPGGVASTYIHGLKEGDEVTFTGPYGEFRLSEDPAVQVICVGGGAGMAPMANIIQSIYERWPQRKCSLYFGCRSTRDIFYLDRWQALSKAHPGFQVIYALSDPLTADTQWDGATGFIHLSLEKAFAPAGKTQAFLCGPPPMIDAVIEVLKQKGVRGEAVFYDKF